MTFNEQVFLIILEKGLIAGIAFILWHFYTTSQKKKESLAQHQQQLKDEIRILQRDRTRTEVAEEIALLERQLSEFLLPMTYHLQKDDALWRQVPQLCEDARVSKKTGTFIEADVIIPNHVSAVQTIEKSFGLLADNAPLSEAVVKYVRHVVVYQALRDSKEDLNPIDVNEPFPDELPELILIATTKARNRLASLRQERWGASG